MKSLRTTNLKEIHQQVYSLPNRKYGTKRVNLRKQNMHIFASQYQIANRVLTEDG